MPSVNGAGKTGYPLQKNGFWLLSYYTPHINQNGSILKCKTGEWQLLEENTGQKLFNTYFSMISWTWHQNTGNKSKNRQEEQSQTTNFLHSQRNNQQLGNSFRNGTIYF
jgi:hypothetical protein